MVNDLLGLARTQPGDGIPIERAARDLLEMCQWVIDDASAAHPRAGFTLNATGELMGSFDRVRLRQLLAGLANNAAQHGEPGKPIVIDIAGEQERVLLKVRKEGRPIPKSALPKLFHSLVQPPRDVHRRDTLAIGGAARLRPATVDVVRRRDLSDHV